MAACRMLVRLVSTETGRSRPGVERNGHQCHRETARAAVRQAAGNAEVSTREKALNKALDRLRRPDATLVLTYVNDGSSVTGRAYFIMPGGHRVMDQTARQTTRAW